MNPLCVHEDVWLKYLSIQLPKQSYRSNLRSMFPCLLYLLQIEYREEIYDTLGECLKLKDQNFLSLLQIQEVSGSMGVNEKAVHIFPGGNFHIKMQICIGRQKMMDISLYLLKVAIFHLNQSKLALESFWHFCFID